MGARENIGSAHTEVEKTLADGRNLKGAKERNEYLTPNPPTCWNSTWQTPPDLRDHDDIVKGDDVVLARNHALSLSFLSESPHLPLQKLRIATNLAVFSLCFETTGRFVEGGLMSVRFLLVSTPLVCSLSGADLVLVSLDSYE